MEPKKNPVYDVHRYSKTFFLIGLIISCSIAIMAFEWRTEVKKITILNPSESNRDPLELYPVPVTGMNEAPKPEPIKRKPLVIVDPDKIEIATNHVDSPTEPITIEIPTDLPGSSIIDMPAEIAPDTFIFVQNMPVPVNGYEGFYKQLSKNIKYPSLAERTGTEGKVYIEFVINENGTPINLKVTKGIGQGCDEEAKRVIAMTKWEPGKQRGIPVLVKMTLPIYFRLRN